MSLGPPSLAALQHICLNLRARDAQEMALLSWGDDRLAMAARIHEAWGESLLGQVASIDGEPVAVIMLRWRTPAALNAALLATERWPEIAAPLMRHCRRVLKPKVIAAGVARVDCQTWSGHDDARRFLEMLGARAECTMPGYGRGGASFIQYAWLNPSVPIAKQEA